MSQVKKDTNKHKANHIVLQKLRDQKAAVKIEPMDLNITYTSLKDDMRGQVFQPSFIKKKLCLAYNEMDSLKQGMKEMRESQDALGVEFFPAREEVQNSRMKL